MLNPEVKEGDQIVLVSMAGEAGMPPGLRGVVETIGKDPFEEDGLIISVDWENGRSLSLVSTEDLWMSYSDYKKKSMNLKEQEDDIEIQYSQNIAKSTPFNTSATASCAAMKASLKSNGIKFAKIGKEGSIELPGVKQIKPNTKTGYKIETQQRFIQWYSDVIKNPDSPGVRGKIFEGLIGGVFGGTVENNENESGVDRSNKTDVSVGSETISIKFVQNYDGGTLKLGGVVNGFQKEWENSIQNYSEDELIRLNELLQYFALRKNIKSNDFNSKRGGVFTGKYLKDVFEILISDNIGRKFIDNSLNLDETFSNVKWLMVGEIGKLNEIDVHQFKMSDIINHIMNGNYLIQGNSIAVKKIRDIKPQPILKIKFPQYAKTKRLKYQLDRQSSNKFSDTETLALRIRSNGDLVGSVFRSYDSEEKMPSYRVKKNKKISKELEIEAVNDAIRRDLEKFDTFDLPEEYTDKRNDFLSKLQSLSDEKSNELFNIKKKLGSEKSKEGQLNKIIGGERKSTLDPSIVKNIRKNPVRFIKNILDLYKDNEEVKKYLSTLTEQTKEDITKKLIDSDVDPLVIKDLLDSLTDEDITDLVVRNLDRKLFKGGDKEKNIRDYFEKYIESLANRTSQDPSDDFDVEDEFLYGGVEPEKSKIGRKQFKKELLPLQVELLKLQEDVKKTGKAIAVVFEGRDSAGKGSVIKQMTEYLDPKYFNVIALGIPTPEERKDWFGRYEKEIQPGKINFFDRSWYNRGIVEPVMGYSSQEEYLDFMENVNQFEQSLLDKGIELVKFWLSITPETQKKRFALRKASPLKYWKFSPNDEKSIDKWDKYTEYKNKVLKQTKEAKPWTVVDTNDKRAGILNAFRHLLNVVNYEGKEEENVGSVYPEVVTTIKEKEMTEGKNYHWKDWEGVQSVLGKPNQSIYDFFEALRMSGVMNMLESTNFIYSGADYLKSFIQHEKYGNYNEEEFEELYDLAENAKHTMIGLAFDSLEKKEIEPTLENMNSEIRQLARLALRSFIMRKSL